MSGSNAELYLSTGDPELNRLLVADGEPGKGGEGDEGGLRVGELTGGHLRNTPIVLIEGTAGTGKTTLALQIASAVAQHIENGDSAWRVLFLSLEQPAASLMNVVRAFGLRPNDFLDLSKVPLKVDATAGKVLLCSLSPLPLADHEPDRTFDTRFAELRHMIETQWDKTQGDEKIHTFCVLDSMNALTSSQLTRSQIHQLFSLFRTSNIPLLATLEHSESREPPEKFLADVVLELSRDEKTQDYLQFTIEVSKSRVCRQGLGKHLYKIRTEKNAEDVGSSRMGVVVYPSVHFILSQARKAGAGRRKPRFQIAKELSKLIVEKTIAPPACFAVMGPPGTHKLALGLNLSISYVNNKAKLLVIMFGGQGKIDFRGVAWVENQEYLRNLVEEGTKSQEALAGTKSQVLRYAASKGAVSAEVTVLTFKIGVLTPEECLYKINQVLNDRELGGFQSVLLCDTAELCTGFPLLSKAPMFFAALLDLFATQGLMTVGIGVRSTDEPSLREINLALMAKATHRMQLHQFPVVEELMRGMVKRERRKQPQKGSPRANKILLLPEQLISVVTDNVVGKHYKRQPKWIWVEEKGRGRAPKTLHCEKFEKPNIKWI